MRLLIIIGVLMLVIGSTAAAFARQPEQGAQNARQGGRCASDACVHGSLKAGWTNVKASEAGQD